MKKALLIIFMAGFLSGCFPAYPGPTPEQSLRAESLIDDGVTYLHEGSLDEAEAAFEVARELTGQASAIDGLGCVAFMRKEYAKAESFFVEAWETDMNYHASLGNLALLYEVQGLSMEAGSVYRYAIEADPSNVRARNNFGAYLHDSKEQDRQWAARNELLKAAALAKAPLIMQNLKRLEAK